MVANIILGILGLLLLLLPAPVADLRFMSVVCLVLPLQVVLLAPHELAHALTARLLGLRVFSISFGLLGRTLCKGRLLGCTLELKSFPFIGLTQMGHKTRRWLRLKHFLIILAGPLVNAALLVVAYPAFVGPRGVSTGTLLLKALFWGNLLMLVFNLWPRRIMGSIPSDGLQLLSTPFLSEAKVQDQHLSYFLDEGIDSLDREEWASARGWFERGLAAFPENPSLLSVLGMAVFEQGQFEETRDLCAKLLARQDLNPAVRAVALSTAAWADLFIGDPALLGESDLYSRESMEWLPWLASVKGARGSVLVELGRAEEGIPLLRDAWREYPKAKDKAIISCYLAIGFMKRGNLRVARIQLEEARKLDPQCPLLGRVISELCKGDEATTR